MCDHAPMMSLYHAKWLWTEPTRYFKETIHSFQKWQFIDSEIKTENEWTRMENFKKYIWNSFLVDGRRAVGWRGGLRVRSQFMFLCETVWKPPMKVSSYLRAAGVKIKTGSGARSSQKTAYQNDTTCPRWRLGFPVGFLYCFIIGAWMITEMLLDIPPRPNIICATL